jgi:putative transposase
LRFWSDGRRAPAPQLFRRRERQLRRAQRTLARRRIRSQRRAKAKQATARIQAKTANQRGDFLHKLTAELVGDHEGLCLEDLSVRGLAKTKLAKSILDASWGEFRRQIGYKTVWNRKHLAMLDRFYPSSKTCHACGAVNAGLTLADRSWTCVCGILHDRDLNAARNILFEGLKRIPLAAGHAESLNVRGPGIRPLAEAIGDEARIPRL